MGFDYHVLLPYRQEILDGFLTTVRISTISALLALGIGLLVAVFKDSPVPPLRWLCRSYIQFFRNTPLLVQMYFFYKGLPYLGLTFPAIICGIIALTLQTGAYMAEIFRSGMAAIPKEQYEGGLSLGFSRLQTIMTVIIPQSFAILLPPIGNQVVGLIKNSSLVAFIAVPDLFGVIYTRSSDEFRYLEFFTVGILLYMALTLIAGLLFALMEKLLVHYKVESNQYA